MFSSILNISPGEQLVKAAHNCDFSLFSFLHENYQNEFSDDQLGQTLVEATTVESFVLVEFMLCFYKNRIPQNFKNEALLLAAANDYFHLVNVILDKCSLSIELRFKMQALYIAVQKLSINSVNVLLSDPTVMVAALAEARNYQKYSFTREVSELIIDRLMTIPAVAELAHEQWQKEMGIPSSHVNGDFECDIHVIEESSPKRRRIGSFR